MQHQSFLQQSLERTQPQIQIPNSGSKPPAFHNHQVSYSHPYDAKTVLRAPISQPFQSPQLTNPVYQTQEFSDKYPEFNNRATFSYYQTPQSQSIILNQGMQSPVHVQQPIIVSSNMNAQNSPYVNSQVYKISQLQQPQQQNPIIVSSRVSQPLLPTTSNISTFIPSYAQEPSIVYKRHGEYRFTAELIPQNNYQFYQPEILNIAGEGQFYKYQLKPRQQPVAKQPGQGSLYQDFYRLLLDMCKLEQEIEDTKVSLQNEQFSIPFIFQIIDSNNTQRISAYEMQNSLTQQFGIQQVNQEDLDYLFRLHTAQYKGYITLDDFQKLFYPVLSQKNQKLMEEQNQNLSQAIQLKITQLFNAHIQAQRYFYSICKLIMENKYNLQGITSELDTSGNGTIARIELQSILQNVQSQLIPESYSKLLLYRFGNYEPIYQNSISVQQFINQFKIYSLGEQPTTSKLSFAQITKKQL